MKKLTLFIFVLTFITFTFTFFLTINQAILLPSWTEAAKAEAARTEQQQNGLKTIKLGNVVVTATKTKTPLKELASSITVITDQEIENKKQSNVLDSLRSVPSLDIVRSGGPGTTASIFIRGAKSEHTLFLIDGIEMNDPMSSGRVYDLTHLMTDNVERIEVLRGPQSTLYGSDAIGGVINIITKKGEGKPSLYLSNEIGSFHTINRQAGLSGGTEKTNYSLTASHSDTDGFSSASKNYGNTEDDGYTNTNLSARLGYLPTEEIDLDLVLRHIKAKTDLDIDGGDGNDDPNYVTEYNQLFSRIGLGLSLLDGLWEQKIGLSIGRQEQDYRNDKDALHPQEVSYGAFDSLTTKTDWQHNLHFSQPINTLTIGFEYEEEAGSSSYYGETPLWTFQDTFKEKKSYQAGAYLQDQLKWQDNLFATIGVRSDHHDRFGTETTYRLAPAYIFPSTKTKLKGTFGTGFKAPSLYQLYSPYGGNNTLEPETSQGYDLGFEQPLSDILTLGSTFFDNRFKNMIDYDYANSKHENIKRARANGVESFVSATPFESFSIQLSHSYTNTRDNNTGRPLLRRAKHKAALDFDYTVIRKLKKTTISLGLVYIGKRDDKKFDPVTYQSTDVILDDYVLVKLAASYQFDQHIELFSRIDNLFNQDYEEVYGYGTAGFSIFGGLKIRY